MHRDAVKAPRPPWRALIAIIASVAVSALTVTGCGLLDSTGPHSGASSYTQGDGLPALQRLDWGMLVVLHAAWSPDGKWIAAMGGPALDALNLEVVTPDGRTRISLASWHCGPSDGLWGIAWLPDGQLSCFAAEEPVHRMCVGAAPFTSCSAVALPASLRTAAGSGGLWSPDGQHLLLPSPVAAGHRTDLYVISPAGRVTQTLPFSAQGGIDNPHWLANATMLAYNRNFDIVASAASFSPLGTLTLGAPKRLLAGCAAEPSGNHVAWSPSGRWLAANCLTGSRFPQEWVYLVDTAHPAQATAIVKVQQHGRGMLFPMWSPDGATLIVFGWSDGQPYTVNIGAYLRGKGLSA